MLQSANPFCSVTAGSYLLRLPGCFRGVEHSELMIPTSLITNLAAVVTPWFLHLDDFRKVTLEHSSSR